MAHSTSFPAGIDIPRKLHQYQPDELRQVWTGSLNSDYSFGGSCQAHDYGPCPCSYSPYDDTLFEESELMEDCKHQDSEPQPGGFAKFRTLSAKNLAAMNGEGLKDLGCPIADMEETIADFQTLRNHVCELNRAHHKDADAARKKLELCVQELRALLAPRLEFEEVCGALLEWDTENQAFGALLGAVKSTVEIELPCCNGPMCTLSLDKLFLRSGMCVSKEQALSACPRCNTKLKIVLGSEPEDVWVGSFWGSVHSP